MDEAAESVNNLMSKVNILVVDDRPEGILAVQAVLNSPNYNIMVASSGSEALKHLLLHDFAVILLDVQMPLMNGFETAAIIKTREKSKDIPIVFMSAINQDEQYVYQGYGVGAVDYLLKPFDPYILRSKVAIFVDIFQKKQLIKEQTEKLHAQELSRLEFENLKRYEHLANSIPQIVFRLKLNGEYEYFNRVWFEYTGLGPAGCFDQKWKDVFHPDDLHSLTELFDKDTTNDNLECECRILNKSGQFRWHLIQVHAERFKNGTLESWLGTATDIEDRKKNEEMQTFLSRAGELLVSSLDYRKTIDLIAQWAVPYLADWCSFDVLDENGTINNLVIYHRDPKQLESARVLHEKYLCNPDGRVGPAEVIKTGQYQLFESIDENVLKEYSMNDEQMDIAKTLGDSSALIVPLSHSGHVLGAITFVSSHASRTYDKNYVETALELSRRVSLALENAKLYKMSQDAIEVRNDFLSIASHELNTPITSLKLQLQMVKKGLLKGGSVERFNKSIEASVKQVDRLINLVQILLDVSRIQSGKFTFNFEETNSLDLVEEVIDRHAEMITNSDCTLEVVKAADVQVVWDRTRIEQLLTNLLTNAIKYAPGKIQLTVDVDGEWIVFHVKDFGDGIDKDKLKSIFDRFERATNNQGVSGLGLGLYIVKQIAEGHQGKVEVTSKVSEGTTFTVYLPKNVSVITEKPALEENHLH